MNREPGYFAEIQDTLYAAVIADILDGMGRTEQVMEARIRPISGPARIAGRAATMLAADEAFEPETPYARQIEATDSLQAGDLVIANANTSAGCAFWGELFAAASLGRGARGAIIDGRVRDTGKMDDLEYPCFATGIKPVNSRARLAVCAYAIPIWCGGVHVNPGDLVFAEADGIVVVPAEIEAEVIEAALATVVKEDAMRADLLTGVPLREAFDRHRVL